MADRLRHAASSPADIDQVDIAGDRELVERFQLGDETAFAELYSRQVFVRTPRGLVRLTGPRS